MQGHMGEASGDQEAESRAKENTEARAFMGLSSGKTGQGRLKSSRLVRVKNFGRLWAKGVVSSCLVPGPGMIKAEE